ncbi:MAG: GNAT family N-acetyltransferase [Chitinophagaceae bacterium]|nr:GNAT family N-acetyltransferase [Oligoflexus sp.]
MLPLSRALEEQTVQVIRKTLFKLPEGGAELGATLRKLDNFYASYDHDGLIYLVLMDTQSESVVGGVGIVSFAGLDPEEGIGEIRELTVDPVHRGQGLGMKLLNAAIDTALSFNYKRLYLETTHDMSQALSLFERFGFRPVSLQQKDTSKRKEPLIRQAGRPAFYVWEASEPERV